MTRNEEPFMSLAAFVKTLPAHVDAFAQATRYEAEKDVTFQRDHTFEGWLKELLAYEQICRIFGGVS